MMNLKKIRADRRAHLDGAYEVRATDQHRALIGFIRPESDESARWEVHACDLSWAEDDVAPTTYLGLANSSHAATERLRAKYQRWAAAH